MLAKKPYFYYNQAVIQSLRNKTYHLLRRSEDFFKTDMVYLAKGGLWLTLFQIFSAVIALSLSVVFANFFPKHEFGIYKYVISAAGIIGAFSLTGLGTAVTKAVSEGYDGTLREGYWTNLKWSGGIIIISLGLALYYFFNENAVLAASFIIIALTAPVINSTSLFTSFLNGKKDFKRTTLYGTLKNIFTTLPLIIAIFITSQPLVIILIYFASSALSGLIFYLLTIKIYKIPETSNAETTSYAKHLSLMSVLNIIAENVDKVVVFQYVGAVELAIYTFATAIPVQIKSGLKNIYQLAFPKFTLRSLTELKKEMPRKIIIFFLVTLPIAIAYVLSAPTIFTILFPKYLDAVIYSQVFSIGLLFYSSLFLTTALQSQKMIPQLYKANLFSAISKIISLAIFVFFFGLWGVIIARVANEAISLIINSILFFSAKESS